MKIYQIPLFDDLMYKILRQQSIVDKILLTIDQDLKVPTKYHFLQSTIREISALFDPSSESSIVEHEDFGEYGNNRIDIALVKLRDSLHQIQSHITSYNEILLENSKADQRVTSFKNRLLDHDQTQAVFAREKNVLVFAGAGTGKTTTILGRIKYLLLVRKVIPMDILVLTYTKSAANDLIKRLRDDVNSAVEICTIHKHAYDVIRQKEGLPPSVCHQEVGSIIQPHFDFLIKNDPSYSALFLDYLYFNQYYQTSVFKFNNREEYSRYLKLNPIITIKGEQVKSTEEVRIANFLHKNSIKYVYEKKYNEKNALNEINYYPDFFLPEFGIYIEHFALDKNGQPPAFFDGVDNGYKGKGYKEGIIWKRKIHEKFGTTLIETYSHEFESGAIFKNLEAKLKRLGVRFTPKTDVEIFEELVKNRSVYNGLIEFFAELIVLAKTNHTTLTLFRLIGKSIEEEALIRIVYPLYVYYQNQLKQNNEIDFSDMLISAVNAIEKHGIQNDYKYVIIDEFQDMTNLTYEYLKVLRKSNDFELYCVGDDWQSIFRFAGSNIDYIVDFEKYFGKYEEYHISQTYRFGKSIADISSEFIKQNAKQSRKMIYSRLRISFDDVHLLYARNEDELMRMLVSKLQELDEHNTVMLIGRFNFDIRMLKSEYFSWKYSQADASMKVMFQGNPNLEIRFMTAHKAKGLEADYVFILNNKNDVHGFPSLIQGNPILDRFLSSADSYPYAEERRLFYVCLTRAKKKVWLLVNQESISIFVRELVDRHEYLKEQFSKFDSEKICPKCFGTLVRRKNSYGEFYGCSNYPICRYREDTDGKVYMLLKPLEQSFSLTNQSRKRITNKTCPSCGKKLIIRVTKNGAFYGCSNYPSCEYTKPIRRRRY